MSTPAPGTRLGPYELISSAGAGGMGEVWKARDTRIDRIVAVKISQQQFSERFEREARAIAALNHPNICALYDVGPDYLVMEYVDGVPIRPPSNLRKLLDLAVQIAAGLAAAHDRGITHRDLKPENILVTSDGHVKILDFGLAKQTAAPLASGGTQAATLTHPGLVMGTVAYMSPEQACGLPLDARSDQFSFGIILYELATGKRPFARDSSPQTMTAIIESEPEPLPPTVPAPLRWTIERCLAKEPASRYESTRDLYRELSSLREHLSEVLSSGYAAAVAAPVKRRWLWPALTLLGALLVAAAGFWAGWRMHLSSSKFAAPMPLTSSGGLARTPTLSPDGSEVAFAWSGPRSMNANLYVKLIGANGLLRLTNNTADEDSPAWSPDGKQIAFVRRVAPYRHAIMLISPLGGSERKLTEVPTVPWESEGHFLLAWSPDGNGLAVSRDDGLDFVSLDSGEKRSLTKGKPGMLGDFDPAFSPGGDRLAFVRRIGPYSAQAFWMPLAKGYRPAGLPKEIRAPGNVAYSPVWSSDNELLLASGAPFAMRLYRVGTTGSQAVQVGREEISGSLALNRTTGRLVFPSLFKIQNLYQILLDGRGKIVQSPERLTSTTGGDFFPLYSPDSRSIAFASSRFGESGIWTIPVDGPLASQLVAWHPSIVSCTDWSPDGKSLVLFANTEAGWFQIYRLAPDTGKVNQLTNDEAHNIFPTFSRDGKWIYFASSRGQEPKLYRMPSAGGPATPVFPRATALAHESADGRWLYFADLMPNGGIYRMPLGGGDVLRIIGHFASPAGWTLNGQGIYYWASDPHLNELRYLNLESQRDTLVLHASLPALPQLSLSPDGRRLAFPLIERNSQELMIMEHER